MRLRDLLQPIQWNVETLISTVVCKQFPVMVIGNQHRRATIDSIDDPGQLVSLVKEPNGIAGANPHLGSGRLRWCQQLMGGLQMPEEPPNDGFESMTRAAGIIPEHHFQQVHQLVFKNPLQGVQSVVDRVTTWDRQIRLKV